MQTPQDHHPETMDTFPVSPVKGSIFDQMNLPPEEINKSITPADIPLSPSSKYTPDEQIKCCISPNKTPQARHFVLNLAGNKEFI